MARFIAAFALGLAVYALPAAQAASPESPPKQEKRFRRAGTSKTTLIRAIEIALAEVPGEALKAVIDLENGKAIIAVTVFTEGRIMEVEIDGETGRVLEVEPEDGEARHAPGSSSARTP